MHFITVPYPKIGTNGDPIDLVCIDFQRVRAIPTLVVGFDGETDKWLIGALDSAGAFVQLCALEEQAFWALQGT